MMAGGESREIVARIFVCPSDNTQVVREAAKFAIAAYERAGVCSSGMAGAWP